MDEFKAVFGAPAVDIDSVTQAIAAFEETLVTPNSRFDRWLTGDTAALTAEEHAGYELFKSSGCAACHNGPAAGGTSFRKMGVVQPYRTVNPAEGRVAVTGRDADRLNFKVPTHPQCGVDLSLLPRRRRRQHFDEAVEVMGQVQLGRTYTAKRTPRIVAFLKTLTGEQPIVPAPTTAAIIRPDAEAAALRPEAADELTGARLTLFLLEMEFVAGVAGRAHLVERLRQRPACCLPLPRRPPGPRVVRPPLRASRRRLLSCPPSIRRSCAMRPSSLPSASAAAF